MISKRLLELAADFWEEAKEATSFPRDLEPLVSVVKPVTIIALPGLCPRQIDAWLRHRHRPFPLSTPHRWLNGCLVAFDGTGFLFVEASLPADDRRMIVAHELAHFLGDYEGPRERVRRRLGPQLFPVFDGERPPTAVEQLGAALAGVELGTYAHYMERLPGGTYSEATSAVERDANDLALELIVPWRLVLARLRGRKPLPAESAPWAVILQEQFGLPESWAVTYAERLLRQARARRSFSETLGL